MAETSFAAAAVVSREAVRSHYTTEIADEARWPLCVDQSVGHTVMGHCLAAEDRNQLFVADI